jgi:riboflavin transporter FmnP
VLIALYIFIYIQGFLFEDKDYFKYSVEFGVWSVEFFHSILNTSLSMYPLSLIPNQERIVFMKKTKLLTFAAILAAISSLLMYLEISLPVFPSFLKMDLSNIPILIGAFVLGPLYAVAIALIKNAMHLFVSTTAGVGELADFLITSAFVLTAGFIYQSKKTKKTAIIGCVAGILVIILAGVLANKFIILPFYINAMNFPVQAIIDMCRAVNPLIIDINSYLLYAVAPYNLLKGIIISVITILVYKKLSYFMKEKNENQ